MKMRDCPSECGTVDTYANANIFFPEGFISARLFSGGLAFCTSSSAHGQVLPLIYGAN